MIVTRVDAYAVSTTHNIVMKDLVAKAKLLAQAPCTLIVPHTSRA